MGLTSCPPDVTVAAGLGQNTPDGRGVPVGVGPFGYGDAIVYGTVLSSVPLSVYFRTAFSGGAYDDVELLIRRDDGAIVYANGQV